MDDYLVIGSVVGLALARRAPKNVSAWQHYTASATSGAVGGQVTFEVFNSKQVSKAKQDFLTKKAKAREVFAAKPPNDARGIRLLYPGMEKWDKRQIQ